MPSLVALLFVLHAIRIFHSPVCLILVQMKLTRGRHWVCSLNMEFSKTRTHYIVDIECFTCKYFSLSNDRLRLDKNVYKGFSPEMNSLLVCKNRKKSPPESTHGKSSFWAQIQNGRHYTECNIEMDITLDLSKMETQMKCPFLLILVFQIT